MSLGSGFRVLAWVLSGERYYSTSQFGTFFFRKTEPQPHHHYMASSLCYANAMRASVAVVLALGCGNLIEGQQFGPLSQLFSSSSNSKNSSASQASGSSGFISISDAHSFADQLRCTEFIPLGILRLSVVAHNTCCQSVSLPPLRCQGCFAHPKGCILTFMGCFQRFVVQDSTHTLM